MSEPAPVRRSIVERIVWSLALVVMLAAALLGFFSIQLAESAPQQAAAAGMACFNVIAPYVIARAVSAITR